jgi:hypothetical protein
MAKVLLTRSTRSRLAVPFGPKRHIINTPSRILKGEISGDNLLLETGDGLLLETGDKLLLEAD